MKHTYSSGAVALFVVLFASLLLTVLTVGFMRVMIQEQQQATNQDLSQSAHDSAVSGVEDAKRVIRSCQLGVSRACDAIAAKNCNTVQDAGVVPTQSDQETVIKSGTTGDGSLNQAYTCVTIELKTDDFIGNLVEGQSVMVPLLSTSDFDAVQIEWMHKDNGSSGTNYAGGRVDVLQAPTTGTITSLPRKTDWNQSAPSLLRVQSIMPTTPSVNVDQLDGTDVNTLFFRPSTISNNASDLTMPVPSFQAGQPRASEGTAVSVDTKAVACSRYLFDNGAYACRASLKLASGVVPAGSQVAYLRLTSLYRDTSYRISLTKSGAGTQFDGVQPMVDSTGRAGNLYRRVSSRLSTVPNVALPEYVFDAAGSLCKNFYVTDTMSGANEPCATAP